SGLAGVADNLGLALARVAVREGAAAKTPLVALERIAVEGGRVDLGARQVTVSRVAVNGGATTVVRDADGTLPLLAVLRPAEPPKSVRVPASRPPAPAPPATPWSVALARLEPVDHRVATTGRGGSPAGEAGPGDLQAGG